MKIERVWAMPNKWTFQIKPIKELLERYNVGEGWIDPFAGEHSPAEITNDHRPDANSTHHMDAVDFAKMLDGHYVGCLFDPPYSIHEVKRHYDSLGRKYDFQKDPTCCFKEVRDILATKVDTVIYFGWNTNAFGKKRGFEIVEVLVVAHGGGRNDTLVTVERKKALPTKQQQLSFISPDGDQREHNKRTNGSDKSSPKSLRDFSYPQDVVRNGAKQEGR